MEPTTWTPERALEMFKDWDDPDLTMHGFCEKWYVSHNPDDFARIAIAALESAAAEIERQKARADLTEIGAGLLRDKLQVEISEVERQRARAEAMRKALIQCGRNVGGGIDDAVSDDFLLHVPEEARLVVERLKAELAKAQQQHPAPTDGPSDEEIEALIDEIKDGATWKALRWIARRAGVRL